MTKRFKIAAALVLALIITVSIAACGKKAQTEEPGEQSSSGIWSAITSGAEETPQIKQIEFAAGTIPEDAENIELVIEAEELDKLDEFINLKSVNFLDSTCFEEIAAWAAEHPDVEVSYVIPFPNGVSVPYDATILDLTGLTADMTSRAAGRIKYLPGLENIIMGAQPAENGLGAAELDILTAAAGDISLDLSAYGIDAGGRTLNLSDETLDFIGISDSELEEMLPVFKYMIGLKEIELGNRDTTPNLSWSAIAELLDAVPETTVNYTFYVYGKEFSVSDTTIDLNHMDLGDNGAAIRELLPYLRRCTYLDMDTCGISNGVMAQLRDDFPDVKVVWRVNWGNYSVRTDVERILASKPSEGGWISSSEIAVLKYCTDVKYLDIGHNNDIDDVSFINYMPKLEVVIIAMDHVTDISCFENCPDLEYLEIYRTYVTDISPLANHTKLKHLNLGVTDIADLSPIMDLELDRLFIGCSTKIPADQVEEYKRLHPDTIVNTDSDEPDAANWRYVGGTWPFTYYPRYELLCEQMGYVIGGVSDYCFYWKDPKY